MITAVQQPSTSGGRPSPRAAAWIAWSLWAVSVVLALSAVILVVVTRSVPHSPYDQWHFVLVGHLKVEWPHLTTIRDPAVLPAELAIVRERDNGVRLHAGIG